MNIRQAAAIQAKQHFMRSWSDRKIPDQIIISEEEKVMWRQNVIECVNQSNDLIRAQLKEVVRRMVDEEFPEKWPGFPQKLLGFMARDDPRVLSGALFVLHQILKKVEYKHLVDPQRVASLALLREAQPRLLQVAAACMASGTPDAHKMLKWCLKIYYSSITFEMPMFLTAPDSFRAWLQLLIQVISLDVPKPADEDEDEWPSRPVWKIKKWAINAIFKIFERYGIESQCAEEYAVFAKMYTEQYSVGVLQVVWKLVKTTVAAGGPYMPPRQLSQLLRYIEQSIEPAQTWKLIKPMVPELMETILFPLMCFNEEDAQLWQDDPSEYVRSKEFNGWSAIPTPCTGAAVVLVEMTKKRPKATLDTVFQFVSRVLAKNAELGAASNPRLQDGALHMVALIGNFIGHRERYKGILEQMLVRFIFPEFKSPHAFLRYRASHVMQSFAAMPFTNPANLTATIEATLQALQDKELPVRVQASIALKHLVEEQQMATQALAPHIKEIVGVLLRVLHESESDDIPYVLDQLMERFPQELTPFALELSQQLVQQFMKMLDYDEQDIYAHRPIVASSTMESLKNVIGIVADKPEAMALQEHVCLSLAAHILNSGVMDFIEESFELLEIFTRSSVSVAGWKGFEILYTKFMQPRSESQDFFQEICPFLYNLISVGFGNGVGVPEKAPAAIFAMCKAIWESDKGEDAMWHVGRLLENFMCWGMGKVDQFVPAIIVMAITELMKTGDAAIKSNILRVMCMNMVITALYYSPKIFFQTLGSVPTKAGEDPLIRKFLALWFMHAEDFTGLHNRKLSILALCRLLELPYAQFPAHIQQVWPHLIGHFVSLFSKLEIAYTLTAEEVWDEEEEEVSDDDVDYDSEGGVPDEADVDTYGTATSYMQQLEKAARRAEEEEEDSEELDLGQHGEFRTPLDEIDRKPSEYEVFHRLLTGMAAKDAPAFAVLMSRVTPAQRAELATIEGIAKQKAAETHQAAVKQAGGYNFDGAVSPQTFSGGGGGKK